LFLSPPSLADDVERQQEALRALGGAVNIEKAIVFTANQTVLSTMCQRATPNEGIMSLISRLEYGALTAIQQEQYKLMLLTQAQSNRALWETTVKSGTMAAFCDAFYDSVLEYAYTFTKKHPDLFVKLNGSGSFES
jgi:hypothetical protein